MSTISLTDGDVRVRERRGHIYRFGEDLAAARDGVSHVFMGSVAERVLRKAPCPVLTVRGTEAVEVTANPQRPARSHPHASEPFALHCGARHSAALFQLHEILTGSRRWRNPTIAFDV